MVVRVCERAQSSGARSVTVATDDERIFSAVEQAGHRVLMTRRDHASGTDRVAEAARALGLGAAEIVVNVQGDEPLIEPGLIKDVAAMLERKREASMATACHPLDDEASLSNPNVVKVVLDEAGFALYFSRAPASDFRQGRKPEHDGQHQGPDGAAHPAAGPPGRRSIWGP